MKNRLLELAAQGRPALGTFYELGGIAAAECLGIAGLDFMVVDTEHGPYDVESALTAITAASRRDCAPLVRGKDVTRPSVLKMLDVGAKGLIVPDVRSVEEVRRLVEYAKYYPLGRRGFAPTLASGYGFDQEAADVESYFALCNRETLLLPQCETVGCLEHIEEITAMDGVDGIFVGPFDLSIALGHPGEFNAPVVHDAILRVQAACKRSGKLSIIFTGSAAASRQRFAEGFDSVTMGMDSLFYVEMYKNLVADVWGK